MNVARGAVVLGVKDADLIANLDGLELAVREAKRRRAPIAVVHGGAPRHRLLPTNPRVESERQEHGRRIVGRVAQQLRRISRLTVRVDVVDAEASGVDALLEASASAAMVILPARPRHPRQVAGPGSTIRAVAARSACPVVVVPRQQAEVVRNGIVVGVVAHGRAQGALLAALRMAARDNVPVTAVHAWDAPMGDPSTSGAVPPTVGELAIARDEARSVVAEALARLAPDFPTVDLRVRLPRGRVVDALRAGARDADLLVVGRHTDSRLDSYALGRTTAAMLNSTACPVMVVAPSGPDRGSCRNRLPAEVPIGTGYYTSELEIGSDGVEHAPRRR